MPNNNDVTRLEGFIDWCKDWFYSKTQVNTLLDGKASSSHSHGNLSTDGKIGSVSGKVISTGTNGVLQASTANYFYELTSSNYNPSIDGGINLTVKVTDLYGNAVSGHAVTLYKNGTATTYTGNTTSTGECIFSNITIDSLCTDFSVGGSHIQISANPYPVGSVIFTTTSTNPSSKFGGTWQRIAQGRTIIGQGSGTDSNSTSKSFSNGGTGGEYNHTLTEAEMPQHRHKLTYPTWGWGETTASESIQASVQGGYGGNNWATTDRTDNHYATQDKGSSNAHNNLPPYWVCYIWKRTA